MISKHRSKNVTLHKAGGVNFLINAEPDSFAQRFAFAHGPSVCAMAFRVKNAKEAYSHALEKGANPVAQDTAPMELYIPAIEGIGGSRLYLVDRYGEKSIYDVDFIPCQEENTAIIEEPGFKFIDHLTHNVYTGRMGYWADFYERIFNFRELKYFDIDGQKTGLISKAMSSPCGKIHIPLNESKDDKSQIVEYLKEDQGEGIQHIALYTEDIYKTVDILKGRGVPLQSTIGTYYDLIDKRINTHNENIEELRKRNILIDGNTEEGILLQIFTDTVIGPIFFEIIQRKGNNGFGEGNFKALFESIELDQIRRGIIQ